MMDSFLDELLAPAAPPACPAAANVWGCPLMGAAGWAGGWLVVAPGTPDGGPACAPLVLSTNCWLRTALLSGVWLGLCDSVVDSVCEKSSSAVTWALTFCLPTNGSRISRIRRL